jgi:C-terminal processing protease CtpA/Prc
MHQERLVKIEEALTRAQEKMALAQERHSELDPAHLEAMEQMLAEMKARAEHAHQTQEAALERQFAAQAEAMARFEKAKVLQQEAMHLHQEERVAAMEKAKALQEEAMQLHQEERVVAMEKARAHYAEAMELAQDRMEDAWQQVIVRAQGRVRLGVSLNGNQGDEFDAQGARIESVMEDTPAEEAGLQEGDIITHLNGQSLLAPIPDEADEDFDLDESLPVQRLIALAGELEEGDEVEVRYLRDGDAATVTMEAAEIDNRAFSIVTGDLGEGRILRWDPEERGAWSFTLPDDRHFEFNFQELKELEDLEALEDLNIKIWKPEDMEELENLEIYFKDLEVDAPNIRLRSFREGAPNVYAFGGGDTPFVYSAFGRFGGHGLELTELNPGLAEYFSTDDGLLVLDVDEDSTLGLMAGDVIQAIGGREVEDHGDVMRILSSYEDGETVSFTVVRKGSVREVEGTIG